MNDRNSTRIINIYRAFNPPLGLTQKAFFEKQISILNNVTNGNTIIIGDFNLDFNKKNDVNYSHKHYFDALETIIEKFNLAQIVNFDTWSRIVMNQKRSSLIDHVYIKNPTKIKNLKNVIPPFGDHLMISFEIIHNQAPTINIYRRNWQNYTKESLQQKLLIQNWDIENEDVQGFWNSFESILVTVIDELAPVQCIPDKLNVREIKIPIPIKNKINRRDRLLKKTIANNTLEKRSLLKTLNKEIKSFFLNAKSKKVRRSLVPGNSKSLWDAQ